MGNVLSFNRILYVGIALVFGVGVNVGIGIAKLLTY